MGESAEGAAVKKTKRKKSAKVSVRQRKFLAEKLNGKSSAEAARAAGYSESVARKADVRITGNAAVQEAFKQLLDRAGITDEKLARRLAEGIDAKETKFFAHEGRVISTRTVIDYGTRHRYLELVLKLKGHLINKHEVTAQLSIAEILASSFGGSTEESK